MPDLDQLEQEFNEAREAFTEDRTDENYVRFQEAKSAFVEARVAQRREEELDPNHPRGQVMVAVNDDAGEEV
jgi:hypothetical protein